MSGPRTAIVLARPGAAAAAPPGVDPRAWRVALFADVADLLDDLAAVDAVAARASPPAYAEELTAALAWPPVTGLDGDAVEVAALEEAGTAGAGEAVVVAADAPDLPALLVGKLFSALTDADAAVCPAAGGGLVALATRLPPPGWVRAAAVGLDQAEALPALVAAAPARRALAIGPGWHRLRVPADIARLDPGLEGWPRTRALLRGGAAR